MLIYHPALDPYHSAFRMLHLLAHDPERQYDRRALRILDFYALFQQLIPTIRLQKPLLKWRRQFSGRDNPYWFSGEPALVFARMEPLQATALDLLYAQGLVDPAKYPDGQVQLLPDQFRRVSPPEPALMSRDVLEFLVNHLGALPLHGPGGLKDRTHLLEYRYDDV